MMSVIPLKNNTMITTKISDQNIHVLTALKHLEQNQGLKSIIK